MSDPMPEAPHDAMALLRDRYAIPPVYQAACKCGWEGTLGTYERAKSEADWHNDRDGESVAV